jgi:hypothetical protein
MKNPWHHEFRLIRYSDFLNLKFYLFNLRVSSNNDFLERVNTKEPVYMIVQLPQQHVSEQLIKENSDNLKKGNETRESFVSSFAFKTFKIPDEIFKGSKQLKNNIDFYLNWNKYKLITLKEKFEKGTYSASALEIEEDIYPITLDKIFDLFSQNKLKSFSFESGLKKAPNLPISFYESPRKIFMAFAPHDKNDLKYSIKYSNPSGELIQYFPKNPSDGNQKLFEVWNRNVWYKANNNGENPESKIIGFSGMFDFDKGIEVQPSPLQRENLANLTNLPPQKGQILSDRNIKYDFYNTGAFGESSQYNYFNSKPLDDSNPSAVKHYQIFGTNHITEQGKDNLDIITTRAVDVNTGLKIYVSVVSQRINNYKTSYLQKRYMIEYVTREINYEENNHHKKLPYKKIIALDEKKFFNPKHFKPFDAYAVLAENFVEDGDYPNDLIQFKYIGIDHNGKKHPFEMDMLFIPESTVVIEKGAYKYIHEDINNSTKPPIIYNKNESVALQHQGLLDKNNKAYKFKINSFNDRTEWAQNALELLNQKKAENLNDHLFYIEESISVASYREENDIASIEENNSDGNALLKTDGIFTVGVFENNIIPEFSKKIPVVPQLGFLNAYIPQLKGIEKEPKIHQVTFSENYYSKGLEGLEFLKTLELSQEKLWKITQGRLEDIETGILEEAAQIENLSSNLLNSDSLVNLDLQIDSLSFGNNALISSDAIQYQINDLKVFDPSKIFGNAEILGFDLSKLFAQLLEEELPITKTIQSKIEDVKTDITDLLQDFKTQYGNTGQQIIKDWNDKIKTIKNNLKITKAEFERQKRELERLPELKYKNEAEKLIRLVNENIRNTSKKIISESNLEYLHFYENNIYQVLIDLNQNSIESKIIKDFERNFIRTTNNLLRKISDRKRATAYQIKKTKERFVSVFVDFLIHNLLKKVEPSTPIIDSLEKSSIHNKVTLILKTIVFKTFYEIYKTFGLQVLFEIQDIFNRFNKEDYFTIKGVQDYEKYKVQIKALIPTIEQTMQLVLNNTSEFNSQAISSLEDQIYLAEKKLTSDAKKKVEDYIKYLKIDSLNQEFRKIYKEYSSTKVYVEGFLQTFKYSDSQIEIVKSELTKEINDLEVKLSKKLAIEVNAFIQQIDPALQQKFYQLYDQLKNDPTLKLLSNPKKFDKYFKVVFNQELEKFYDSKRRLLNNEINKLETKIEDFELEMKNSLELLKTTIKDQFKNLTKDEREKLKKIQKILLSSRSQKVEYSFSNKNLKSIDAGIAKLITNKRSSFNIDSKVEILFKNELPPAIEKKEAHVKTELTNIGVNIIDSIQVNFNRIYYQNGTNLPQDFKVEIRDIQFDGVFNFIAAFEKYLKDFGGDNLLLDFDANGATIGYKYPLPNITFGYFNLFNLKLNVLFRLPFITGDPMKVILGINNPKDRFIVTVNGFPGTGYFFVELDPKKGVTMIAFLIEFGAHLSFNFGVASGSASFKAGIYYLKKYDKVDIGGYVICAGHFRVLGLFNASLLFNLRFKLVGDELIARGCVKASYRFSRWFKVSATVPMKHKTSFDHSKSKKADTYTLKPKSETDIKNGIIELQFAFINLEQVSTNNTKPLLSETINIGDNIIFIIEYDKKEFAEKKYRYELQYPKNNFSVFSKLGDIHHDSHLDKYYVRYSARVKELGEQKIVHINDFGDEIEYRDIDLINESMTSYQEAFFNSYSKTV